MKTVNKKADILWPNPETIATATAQLNTNYVTELKTKPEFAGNRGWLSCRVKPTSVMLQSDRRGLFSSRDLLHRSGRLYVDGEIGECSKTHTCVLLLMLPIWGCFISKQTSSSPLNELQKGLSGCDALSLISGVYLVGIWKMLPWPCLVCFHFSWGGERRSHFVPNCWITSANEEPHPPLLDQTQQRGPVMEH